MTTRLKWMTVAIGTAVIASTLALWFLWLGPEPRVLIVGSTTTTQDTGLLDVLQGDGLRASEYVARGGAVRRLRLDGRDDLEPLAVAGAHGEPDRGRP